MKKIFKSVITVGVLAGLSYIGFKGYKRINDVIKMSKTLPDYLRDILGERPKIDINQKLNSLSIAVGLSAEGYENLVVDLEEQIDNYILDYYPSLVKLRLTITKYIKAQETEEDEITLDNNDSDEEVTEDKE